jgi:hypothetical protein
MLRQLIAVCAASLILAGSGPAADDKKSDKDTKVAEGKEITLTPAEIKLSETPDDGRFPVTVKAKEGTKVKMPAQGYALGFSGEPVKGGGLKVVGIPEGSGLLRMRPASASEDTGWMIEEGDIITHANGYAVNSVEELVCAVSLAKDKGDVQIVVKDVNNGKPYAFYVNAVRQ